MNILSLFDGIGCARVALERCGFKVGKYYASEIDKYAVHIAQKNYPDTVQLGDVRSVSKEIVENIDLLIGGSPCQDLSIAKKNREGLNGSRSGLFWEYVRILKEVKPKYFILENVNSMPKEAKQIITEALGVEPIMINAALVSAQNRKRLFWTNIPNVEQPKDKGILLKDILEEGTGVDKSYCIPATYYKENVKSLRQRRKKGLFVEKDKSNTRGAKTGLYAVALRNRGEGKRPEVGGDKANAMTTVQTDSMVLEDTIIRKLTPRECERLQGLPDNYTEGISNTQRYKCLGNAFNVDVIAHILESIKK